MIRAINTPQTTAPITTPSMAARTSISPGLYQSTEESAPRMAAPKIKNPLMGRKHST